MKKYATFLLISLLTACSGTQSREIQREVPVTSIVQRAENSPGSNVVVSGDGSVNIRGTGNAVTTGKNSPANTGNENVIVYGDEDDIDVEDNKSPEFHYQSAPSGDQITIELDPNASGGVSVETADNMTTISVSHIKHLYVNGVEWGPVSAKGRGQAK